ncbi:hypothetical protein ABFT80_06085 [Mesorhizobium sp. SB112]|uniref:hypothetical protein n=1 Tax=Mesorhizobium sp. SB112 TaxID=3151853 RepID=UPI00326658D9
MKKGEQHRMLVDGILNTPKELRGKGFLVLLDYLARIAPDASGNDVEAAIEDAAGILDERAIVFSYENNLIKERYMPLFEDVPAGITLFEAAEHKAHCGDPLGIEVFKELGGVV